MSWNSSSHRQPRVSEDLLLKQNLLKTSWWSVVEVTELAVKDCTVIHIHQGIDSPSYAKRGAVHVFAIQIDIHFHMVICDSHNVTLLGQTISRQSVLLLIVVVQGAVMSQYQAMSIPSHRHLI